MESSGDGGIGDERHYRGYNEGMDLFTKQWICQGLSLGREMKARVMARGRL